MRIALDRQVLRAMLEAERRGHARDATRELWQLDATFFVLPIVAEEIDAEGDEIERRWRGAGLEEVKSDDFLKGCAAGLARRYLDYYPDPRECRLVAEAECARMDALVTSSADLVRRMGRRAENIRIATPSDALARYRERVSGQRRGSHQSHS